MKHIHIDFETYSEADIRKTGAWAYAAHPSTELICMAYKVDDQTVKLTTSAQQAKQLIETWLDEQAQLHAHNSFFEMVICYHVLDIAPSLNPKRWTDTAALAACLALPRSLHDCGQALGLAPDKQKDKRGRYLIQRLSKPYRGKRVQDEALLQEFYDYCKQDVTAEHAIYKRLAPLASVEQLTHERLVWECDQTINSRGLYIDRQSVKDALLIIEQATNSLNQEVRDITNGVLDNVSQRAKVMDYIASLGYPLTSYTKQYLEDTLADEQLPPTARRLIEIRLQTGKTSTAKYQALDNIITPDSRVHGLLMYHGASTGRWSGKHFQPQNLPRGTIKNTDRCIELFKHQNADIIDFYYDDSLEVLSSSIRGMITAPQGKRLLVADYSSIEARVLAWLAGQQDVIDVFNADGKIYEHTAAKIYRVPINQVSKDQRFIGKTAVLALGYQGGKAAFQGMAENYGVEIADDLAEKIKNDWREANQNIVRFWWALNEAAMQTVRTGNPSKTPYQGITFHIAGGFLFCRLPSGRYLAYHQPQIGIGTFGNDAVTYMGVNGYSRKWERQQIYGGKIAENIAQGVARDLMANAMLNVEQAGYEIVLSVHDELIAEAPTDFGNIEEFIALMCKHPDWAQGLPLSADGESMKRYRK